MTYHNPGISFDAASFEPMRIMPVRHELIDHPLLSLGNLVELARRLERTGSVRAHADTAVPETVFTSAPDTHPIARSVSETIADIEHSKAWMALHNIQNDPLYRTLVDEVLDYVRPMIEPKDPGMFHRAGWIFVTSPHAITPYHLDHEHNFILQIRGRKSIHVFDPRDRSVVSEQALELFHMKLSRELVVYQEELEPKARVFDAGPGMGAYMPTTAPHWVENGDDVSITASFTYYTRRTYHEKALHRANYAVRALGLSPRPVGSSWLRNQAKLRLFLTQQRVKRSLAQRPLHPSLQGGKYAVG